MGKRTWGVLPGAGVPLLPKVTCPMCWPAYAGLLSSAGRGFLPSTGFLPAVTAAFLLAAVAALGLRAEARRGYGPMLLGALVSAAVLTGKFFLESHAAMYGGLSLLVAASAWNRWPRPATASPRCVPARREFIQFNPKEK